MLGDTGTAGDSERGGMANGSARVAEVLAPAVTASSEVRYLYDQLLVKEEGVTTETLEPGCRVLEGIGPQDLLCIRAPGPCDSMPWPHVRGWQSALGPPLSAAFR